MSTSKELARLRGLRTILPTRFMKFGLVGGIGIVVNLTAMAIIIHFTGWRDWRASALATFFASVNNYFLNNMWTFRDRARTGSGFFRGYVLFLIVSIASLLVTVSVYTGLTKGLDVLIGQPAGIEMLSVQIILFFQFVAILCGAYFNYVLNKAITWKA